MVSSSLEPPPSSPPPAASAGGGTTFQLSNVLLVADSAVSQDSDSPPPASAALLSASAEGWFWSGNRAGREGGETIPTAVVVGCRGCVGGGWGHGPSADFAAGLTCCVPVDVSTYD